MQGRVLAGRYRLESQLGVGGMGSVWRAEHLTLHSAVAVKLMDPAIAATVGGTDRFRREAQAAASLRSAHVVQVLDYGVDEGTPFLVMELLEGESLAACLEREHRLSPQRVHTIMVQVARAMTRAHASHIVHRDLKPDNIFLVREDGQELVKVLDFGIAKTGDASFGGMQTRTGITLGTPYYMSPEQAEGKRAVDHRTDLWAMAVIATECITGVRPFNGETWGELLLNICARPITVPSTQSVVPLGFDAWFARATSREPEQRYRTAQELVDALGEVVGATPPRTGSPETGASDGTRAVTAAETPAVATTSASRRRLMPIGLVVLALAAGGLVALVGVTVYRAGGPGLRDENDAAASDTARPIETVAKVAPDLGASSTVNVPSASAVDLSRVLQRVAPAPSSAGLARAAPSRATRGLPVPARVAGLASSEPRPPVGREPRPPSAGALRCYSDPFTGAIRLEGAGPRPAGAQPFPCKQNAFTGQYQRL